MTSAGTLLTEAQKLRIDHALAAAQERTSARIIPVVARSSGQYQHAEELVGWWAAALGLALTGVLITRQPACPAATVSATDMARDLGVILAVITIGAMAGFFLGDQMVRIRRLFVTRKAMRQAVHRRAQHALADFRLRSGLPAFGGHPGRQAERRSIVVIFASMYERAVVVVADGPALAQLSAAGVAPIEAAVMEGITGGTPCEGMCHAVSITAEAMSAVCPPSGGGLDLAGSTVRILD